MAAKDLRAGWRNTRLQGWLVVWLATLHLVFSSRDVITPVTPETFKFTAPVYNASITENAVGKVYAVPNIKMGIHLSDPTLSVKYRITGGDPDKFFKPETRIVGDFCFLRIRTRTGSSVMLNRERQDRFELKLKAVAQYTNGPQMITRVIANLLIRDVNDLSPLFYPESYEVEIREDTLVHTSIVTVSASDADIGVNGEVYYSFKERTPIFAIHPTSGVVTLTRKVKYIEENHYTLTVHAEDRGPNFGHGRRVSRAHLSIKIIQVNFNAPEIRVQHLPSIMEHGVVGTTYAVLIVHDKDIGENGLIDRVEIIDGDPDGFFKLEHGKSAFEYSIQIAKTLDRETTPNGFNLTIRAWDGGKPPRFTIRDVYVKLSDTNDHPPRFSQSYSFSVDEVVPMDTPLVFVNASDKDTGRNAQLLYNIIKGNELGFFKVNPVTGLISTASALDAETVTEVELTVEAQDTGNIASRKYATTKVRITILDCNDNAPVFNHTEDTAYVSESMPVGTEVYQVSAYDVDWGENGYITYSIANTEEVPFEIDHFTGKISTKKVLDYEYMRRVYLLRIRASDWGSPFRRESEKILRVRVNNANDNKPQFEKVDCMGYLSREAPVGTELVTMSAIDFDAGSITSYIITGGNEDDCFEILKDTGDLKLKCSLQDSKVDFRSLAVTASDGVNLADPTTVNITLVNNNRNHNLANKNANINCRKTNVEPELRKLLQKAAENNAEVDSGNLDYLHKKFMVNNHAPKFAESTPKAIEVKEGLSIGTSILKLVATDEDPGYNGRILYVVAAEGNEDGDFKIDTYTGELQVQSYIDREIRDVYNLKILAYDMGIPQKVTSISLHVKVLDVNDCTPRFEMSQYEAEVSESVLVNTSILSVSAVDDDVGSNAEIRYEIVTDTEDFRIDGRSGIITVSNVLDREVKDKHTLIVKATDGSVSNPLSATVLVVVTVSDINDNAPQFLPKTYGVRVREDLPVGTVIMILTAADPDENGGGIVRYNLQDGMDDKFEVDRHTGVVRIAKKLDFETKQNYNITVKARDRGTPNLFSKTYLFIEVVDVNENLYPPSFGNFVLEGFIKENEPIGSEVMQVKAEDADKYNKMASPMDSQVTYSIRGGTGLGIFTIDSKGVIRTNEVLDRESKRFYWLTVYAQDRGAVPLHSTVEVLITVEDVNDNIPQTPEPVYYPAILENSPAGTSVVKLEGFDLDDTGSQQLTYAITSGNPQGFFTIDRQTGLITTTNRKLDREKQEEHFLEVSVSDNGVPSLTSTTRVVVTIADLNDEAPIFTERFYRVRILELVHDGEHDVPLYRVVAYDRDDGPNGNIDFSLRGMKGNSKFRIHAKTGMIYAARSLEHSRDYELLVKAVDNGRPQKKSTTRVRFTVMERPANSTNPPSFVHQGRTTQVMENDQIGHHICIMSATDADDDKLYYSITDGNKDDKFTIGTETGNILLAGLLDWETQPDYNLTVSATDGVHTVYSWVYIKVLDINDNRPQFSQSTYTANILESTAPGTSILTIIADDRDENKRLFYTIHTATHPASMSKFKINSETDGDGKWRGVITTIAALDREAIAEHDLTVMVRDQGTPSKRSLARVVISIQDQNDHRPEFLSEVFEGHIFETAAIGSSVLQVIALDRDKGKNAELRYSIVSGNVGNAFVLDSTLGIITVAKQLDRDSQSEYNLVVKATDGGSPSLSSTTKVHILVTVANNAPPKFSQAEYATELHENQALGTFVISLTAISRSSVVYEIVSGNQQRLFSINPNSGVVYTSGEFDYEETSFYNLTVRATNMVSVYSDAILLVHIVDENDNKPVFTQSVYVGNISEASHGGSVILDAANAPLVVKAVDKDTDLNALLDYSIIEPKAQYFFTIDSNTGAIRTRVNLDHEVASFYEFTVQVMDMGKPRLSAEVAAKVHINVLDVNDSPPRFTQEVYKATLLLPTYKDVAVIRVTATDPDSKTNTQLQYGILKGNKENKFAIDPLEGIITVTNDTEMLKDYEMIVRVTDGKFQNQAKVLVTVTMTKQVGLGFSQDIYHAEIMENTTGVQTVAIVQAVGHALNEHLTFTILNPIQMFKVGATSGVVQSVGMAFDREEQNHYTIVVEVRDSRSPPRFAHVLVEVDILDMNDNSPIFMNQPFYAIVPVDAKIGDLVKKVDAIDRDVGKNGEVQYSLVSGGDGKFRMEAETGHILLNKKLDNSDQHKEYSLLIQAEDKGDLPRKSRAVVPVKIMNKATPVFDSPTYTASIPEDVAVDTVIISIEAKSPHQRKLIYSISKGNTYDEFAVDFNTDMDKLGPCSITVVDQLDYETKKRYDLTLRATDILTGSYAECIVHVNIQDVNDEKPSFDSLRYTTTVSEAVPIGTSIVTVAAQDKDSDVNAVVRYQLKNTHEYNDTGYFHIDPTKGIILVKQKLDHDRKSVLRFVVMATDSGIPALSSDVLVTVHVTDLNDNAPRFDQPSYDCTISDQLKRGGLVTIVTASDADSSDEGNLAYSIFSGNDKQTFSIDSKSGVITLSSLRKPDLQPKYTLNVSVTDGVFTNFARVVITVKISNYHVPVFKESVYIIHVDENTEVSKVIGKVSAEDKDTGMYGEVVYRIQSEDAAELLDINKNTGEFSTKVILDREEAGEHQFTVEAIDRGGRIGYANVHMIVADEADSLPVFRVQEYKANVYSSADAGAFVVQVTAADRDIGSNGELSYSLYDEGIDDMVNEQFSIDAKTGVIRLKKSLKDYEGKLIQFFVKASDKGVPVQQANVPVSVLVMGPEDTPPHFQQRVYTYFVSEDHKVGMFVASVIAESNETLRYSIVEGNTAMTNEPPVFSIDKEGHVKTIAELDREKTETYLLSVKAETDTSPPLVAHAEVTVQIMDINDNSPKFDSNPYVVSIAENAEVGSKVVQVEAHDADTGANGAVTYSIAPSHSKFADIFAIDSNSGWITTLVKLDRETTSEYNFDVMATDRGSPEKMNDTTTVSIKITDHNDQPPVFKQSRYQGAVNEDALPGTIIVTMETDDKDIGTNAEVTYYITAGDSLGQFQVRSSGQIYVNKPLDREVKEKYELTVSATDGAFVSTTRVHIDVLDANDNSPVCEQPVYTCIVDESVPVGSFIARVAAKDADEIGTRNARIRYSLKGDGSEMFNMHPKNGIITTKAILDRERVPKYHLTMVAQDGGNKFCTSDVYIVLSDVNDNAPVFTRREYKVDIMENAEVNTLLTRVSASDSDLGINRKVEYLLLDPTGHFVIDRQSGIVSLTQPLDREQQPMYNLTLTARDKGNPSLSSKAQLVVILLDVNDNPPEFERSSYMHSINEATRVGTNIMRVYATSKDTGINAEMTYSIVSGNKQGKYRIDSKTGTITLIKAVDYESARQYFFTVQATDGGSPPLSNTANVYVNITDANDNPPIFSQRIYDVKIREDAKPGDNVIQVKAKDRDSEPNSQVTYAIVSGDRDNQFTVHASDGYVSVAALLDRETVDRYTLEVQATDSGHPRLTTTATVNIEITDANDNPPRFSSDNYTAVIQENQKLDYDILQIDVTDADADPNGSPFTFDIVNGNSGNKFRIDRSGVLKTAAHFDRQIQDVYLLTVRVFDNGAPPLFSDMLVTIKVIEESAFPPKVVPMKISLSTYNDNFPGSVIGRVKASDPDLYDTLQYGIASDNHNLFEIDKNDGTIKAVEGLDSGEYALNVSVTDDRYVVYTTVKLSVSDVSDDMAENAVVVRFRNMLPEEFIRHHRKNFVEAIHTKLSVRARDVAVLSIQPATDTVVASGGRDRRSTHSDLDVLFAVHKTRNTYYKNNILRKRLTEVQDILESTMGAKIVKIFNDVCSKDSCGVMGKCETKVKFMKNQVLPVITDNESYVSIRHALTPVCICKKSYGGPRCELDLTPCARNPCPVYKNCVPDEKQGHKCECPQGKTGPMCTSDVDDCLANALDAECIRNKPMTFNGKSYARWRLADSIEQRLSLSLEIRTVQSTARIMHAAGRVDYSILEIVDGVVQYRFDCGSGAGIVRMSGHYVNDGNWHTIVVERRKQNAEVLLDGKFSSEASAPGTNDVLNLESHDVYFGAQVENLAHGYTDIRKGFEGCMKDIKIGGVKLPYTHSNSVATLQKFENIEFHCKGSYVPGVCSSRPCMNGGTCVAVGPNAYRCHCRERFVGQRCEVDTDPCASNPCLYGGICTNLDNNFRCTCKGRLTGKRCDYGFYCIPNPCKNNGICVEGRSGPICNCNGYEGDLCEHDIDECLENPCKNGASCQNTYGSFRCNCTPSSKGKLCEEVVLSSITSNSWGINLDEIIGIAAVVVGLFVIVMIVVISVTCHRRRKRRRRQRMQDNFGAGENAIMLKCDELKHSTKINNMDVAAAAAVHNIHSSPSPRNLHHHRPSPRPPPVPDRPASYTPSTADSVNTLTLNNFDTVRNYGSAADELENIPDIRYPELPEFLQNLNIDKNNSLENKKIQDELKIIPHHDPISSARGSISSLPVSESEDDMQGYHWDASDWAPNPALPNITEVPVREVPDSPSSSPHSNESNTHIDPNDYDDYDDGYPDDSEYVENDSEYVGDSEYCENEYDDEDDISDLDDPNVDLPEQPNYHQFLALQGGDLNYDDQYDTPEHNYNMHPNQYLPNYNYDMAEAEVNSNRGQLRNPYAYHQPQFEHLGYHEYVDYPPSAIDEMSVSMGGYTSTNASCSDISGLCEIEDSEINMSGEESCDDNESTKLSASHMHTQV